MCSDLILLIPFSLFFFSFFLIFGPLNVSSKYHGKQGLKEQITKKETNFWADAREYFYRSYTYKNYMFMIGQIKKKKKAKVIKKLPF